MRFVNLPSREIKLTIMKNLRNQVQLIGRLGQEVTLTTFDSGNKKAHFSIATDDSYKDADGNKVERTDWHNIVAWGKTAELMEQLLVKGNEVLIQGKLSSRSYEDKNGVKRYITEVVADTFMKLTKAPVVANL